MFLKKHDRKAVFLGMALVFAISVFVSSKAAEKAAEKEDEKPYRIVDGKVDFGTYNGYRRYHNSCHACHGLAGVGSSFAPALIESLKAVDEEQFLNIVVNGRINGRIGNAGDNTKPIISSSAAGEKNVMPSFAMDPNVMEYIDDIYAYVKARSDGVIGPGRPARLPKKKSK